MNIIRLTTKAPDKGTFIVSLSFKDAAGVATIPSAIVWSLYSGAGTVVNSRTSVSVAVPAASVDIVTSGEDLDFSDGPARQMLVKATYSTTEGSNLPLYALVIFEVEDLTGVTA
jgi:hypothetical protein